MIKLRSYVGPPIFIFPVSIFITAAVFSISVRFIELDSIILSAIIVASFFISIIMLSVVYLKWLPVAHKKFVRVGGELYLLYFAAGALFFGLLLSGWSVPKLVSPSIFLLFLLGYHFIINNKDIQDLNIKEISEEKEYIIVGIIGLFCLFGVLWFNTLIKEGTFQFPKFEGLVLVFVIVVTEEIMYRYYIQGTAQKAMKDTTAVLVTSLLFTLQHVSLQPMNVHIVYIFVISVVCGVGYSRYENLSVPLILHAAVNIFPLIFLGGV